MKAKYQRLTLGLVALVGVGGSVVLAMSGLKEQAAYFYTPEDVAARGVPLGRAARLGGMVAPGSITHAADGVTIRFVVSDARASVPVRYAGLTPDLFREGSGVVAEGRFLRDGSFVADNLLAKHDERYMPPGSADAMRAGRLHKTGTLKPGSTGR